MIQPLTTDVVADQPPLRLPEHVQRLHDDAGPRLSRARFKNFVASNDKMLKAVASVEEWASGWPDRPHVGLVLYGPCGTGKDHLAFAAAGMVAFRHRRTARLKNCRALFAEARDDIIRDGVSEEYFLGQLVAPDVLILSDPTLANTALTTHQLDLLYRVVDGRVRAMKSTVITLNVGSAEDADALLSPPIWDRMIADAWLVKCEWKSYRQPLRRVE